MRKPRSTLKKTNSVLAMLSRINRTIVRAESPDELYRAACDIAVHCGLFDAAWVGLVKPATGRLRALASAGGIASLEEQLAAAGGLADAVRSSGTLAIHEDLAALPAAMRCDVLEQRGLHAAAGLPLREGTHVVAVLVVYATSASCFDQSVVDLLAEVADDISFSLDHQLNEQRRLAAESRLHYMASYDAQTGMPNRALLEERLPQLAARAARNGNRLTVLNVRLLRLDKIAALLGPAGMDEVMRITALRLEDCRTPDGMLAQLGHEEFAFAAADLGDDADIDAFARAVKQAAEQPLQVHGKEIFLRVSMGCVVHGLHEEEIGYLLRRVRAASRLSDDDSGFRVYSPELDRDLERHVEMEAELYRALERDEFELYYQPQVNARTGVLAGVEALLRWRHPQRGLISPGEFIPLLEECGLMPRVGTWVLRTACLQASEWQRQGLPPLRVAVNLSAQQFRMSNLVECVQQALDDAGLAAEHLELELTESLILENAEQTIQAMHQLKKLGVSLSLDDFGTGYSSLSYLRRYPVDRIKIDQSFVRDMTEHRSSAALVRSILAMAHNLGLGTIAEGVENDTQLGYLRKLDCQEIQGFLFSRPLPVEEITQLLRDVRRWASPDPLEAASSTVLVVDAKPAVLQLLQSVARRAGWKLLTAPHGSGGLELLAADNIGVVIAGIAGADFLRRVREMYPDTVRLLITADPEAATVIDAVNRGELYRVLDKPADGNVLHDHISDAFRRYEANAATLRLQAQLQETNGMRVN
ncbi:EAL domain-containing protein [Noviherbaspirillum denitrificans]|nr:EAL domain-containing protein [Noviherbaspirillum denitrificans]